MPSGQVMMSEPHTHLGWSINSDQPALTAHMRSAHDLVSDDPLLHLDDHRTSTNAELFRHMLGVPAGPGYTHTFTPRTSWWRRLTARFRRRGDA